MIIELIALYVILGIIVYFICVLKEIPDNKSFTEKCLGIAVMVFIPVLMICGFVLFILDELKW